MKQTGLLAAALAVAWCACVPALGAGQASSRSDNTLREPQAGSVFAVHAAYGFQPSMGRTSAKYFDRLPRVSHRVAGTYSFDFSYRVKRWMDLGLALGYARVADRFALESYAGSVRTVEQSYVCLMFARFNWLNRSWLTLYSGVGAGYLYQVTRVRDMRFDTSETNYARDVTAQLTLIGLKAGRRLHFFAEAGYGALGLCRAGVGYAC